MAEKVVPVEVGDAPVVLLLEALKPVVGAGFDVASGLLAVVACAVSRSLEVSAVVSIVAVVAVGGSIVAVVAVVELVTGKSQEVYS